MRLTILSLLLATGPLAAQEPGARSGFWWGFGLGYGIYHHTCDRCQHRSGTTGISSSYIALGAALNRRVSLGIELAGGTMAQGAAATSASLITTVHAAQRRGLFVRAGVGTSNYKQRVYAEAPAYAGRGVGWSAALGWDVRIEGGPWLTAMVAFRAGAPGTVTAAVVDTAATNLRQRSIALTLGLTFP